MVFGTAETRHQSPEKAHEYFENKLAFTTGPVELNRMIRKGQVDIAIIDVREREDYEQGHIPGAISLPRDKWETLKGLGKDKLNIVYCYSIVCHLAATAAVGFAQRGYNVMELEGGFESWKEHGLEIET